MSKYQIRTYFLAAPKFSDLSDEQFEKIDRIRSFMLDQIRFEESVRQVLYSMEELELFLVTNAIKGSYFHDDDYDFHQDNRLRANLRVLGVLNSISSLKDRFPKFKSQIHSPQMKKRFLELWDTAIADCSAFEFVNIYRNFSQHFKAPVSSTETNAKWDEKREFSEASFHIRADVSAIAGYHQSKRAANKSQIRFEALYGKQCDVALILREALSQIAAIVKTIREEIKSELTECWREYDDFLEFVKIEDHTDRIGIIYENTPTERIRKMSVFDDFLKRSKQLNYSALPTNQHNQFISNRPKGHN